MQGKVVNYFTLAVFGLMLSFILLPSSKMVNNVFYVFIALPAIVAIFAGRVPKKWLTNLALVWVVFFLWVAVSAVLNGQGGFLKQVLYVLLFCAALYFWVDFQRLEQHVFFRFLFWVLMLYVSASAVFLWWSGALEAGNRLVDLPGRSSGPILTSMLIVGCFTLAVSGWVRQRRWLEILAAVAGILFCVGFVLQSRSGLVGLAALFVVYGGAAFMHGSWRYKVGVLLAVSLALAAGLWAFQHSEVAARLIARADAGRFELWGAYVAEWGQCGIWLGCGPFFSGDIYIRDGGLLIHHPHNIFLAMGFYHGLPGLIIFVLVMLMTLFQAWRQKNPWGAYLLVAIFMLNFDGRRLINSPHEVWLLVLLPSMLIAARQRTEKNKVLTTGRDVRSGLC